MSKLNIILLLSLAQALLLAPRLLGSDAKDVLMAAQPMNSQVYARNRLTGRANVAFTGTVRNAGADAVVLKVTRNTVAYASVTNALVYAGGQAPFAIAASIPAELANYGFRLYVRTGTTDSLVATADNVVAGDVFLINGQSNAEAVIYEGSASANQHSFLRSFGTPGPSNGADRAWYTATGDSRYTAGMVGQWGLRMGRLLLNTYQIPIGIINGAEPGKPITYFQRNDANPTDLGTNYGRLLYRVQQAGLTNGVRAMLYYQGESDYQTSAAQHESGFLAVYQRWLADYPSLEKVYVFQVREVALVDAWTTSLDLRNRQRLFQSNYSDIAVMSTTGIDAYGYGAWHYAYTGGYEVLGSRIFNLVARDLYGRASANVEAPDILYACFNNSAHDEVALVMRNTSDTLTWGAGSQTNFAVNGNTSAAVSGAASNNAVILKLNAPVSHGATVSYAGHTATVAPWVANAAGVGMLAFYNVPVIPAQPLSSPALTATIPRGAAGVSLGFDTVQGRFYSVEYSTNLVMGQWRPLPRFLWGTGASIQITNASSDRVRYYRLKISGL